MLRYATIAATIASTHAFAVAPVPATRAHLPAFAAARPTCSPAMCAVATPVDGFNGAVAAGEKKANMPSGKIFKLGIISGAHIGFGAFLAMTIGAQCPGLLATNPGLQKIIFGAFGLPFGLFMTVMSGAELFTGNTALVTMANIEGKATLSQLWKSWWVSYVGNFIGAVGLAWLVCVGGTLATSATALSIPVMKTGLSFTAAFVRGILCNWLVCMAVYLASFCKDAPGKMTAIWFCISAFVALGLEHSVANMFIIPLGIFTGGAVSWGSFFVNNLLPVTLGNIVGGAVCVGAAFCWAYGKNSGSK